MKKINKKIPGVLPPPPKTKIDGKITDLSSTSIPELLELRDRQLKLLNNKSFILKLPDKGAKIQAFHDRILKEILSKQEELQTCRLLENLRLSGVDKESVQDVEWKGKIARGEETFLDSDDDSEPEDVMHILCQSTASKKEIKVLKPEPPLVTPTDLLEIAHVKYIIEKTESNSNHKTSGHFKPFKTTKSDVHDPGKEILRKKHKNWENTAATPPPILHGPAKVLSLEESLKLQKEYNVHLKEVEMQHATEKLLSHTGIKMAEIQLDISKFGKYREASDDSEDSDPEGSDKEVHDDEQERGGVMFTVTE